MVNFENINQSLTFCTNIDCLNQYEVAALEESRQIKNRCYAYAQLDIGSAIQPTYELKVSGGVL